MTEDTPSTGELRPDSARGRVIAVMSGKGGSGKTMVATTIARRLSGEDHPVLLVDGDLGTGGLSYYLALNYVRNIRNGLTDLLLGRPVEDGELRSRYLQRVTFAPRSGNALFLPVGDFRKLKLVRSEPVVPSEPPVALLLERSLGRLKAALMTEEATMVVDCRGGVDEETFAIGRVVDDIILVSEPDTTSFQATRHLAESLSDEGLGHKITGFVLNKVFEDPTVVLRNGTSSFGAQPLGAVPFDPVATRAFLVGEVPPASSAFWVHVVDALARLYPHDVDPPDRERLYRPEQYAALGLTSPASTRGGYALAMVALVLGSVLVVGEAAGGVNGTTRLVGLVVLATTALFAGIESVRRTVGRTIEALFRLVGL
ncbi:AAA family ATPase [Umezawaea tangerina]|uniref:Flagellar biosynthesis protein FlhG n=1 Tax=Umezawaea tangerina TaxID=84725 RepID=A0A2T0SGV2_9PSEU|nr:P-loop NTPase [Umezawaea tangerina]PRY32642.1 flagellar biosynthesis protein FlhG [Umezawaea tangerina]